MIQRQSGKGSPSSLTQAEFVNRYESTKGVRPSQICQINKDAM